MISAGDNDCHQLEAFMPRSLHDLFELRFVPVPPFFKKPANTTCINLKHFQNPNTLSYKKSINDPQI